MAFDRASRYVGNEAKNGIEAQRPWCPYPAIARCNGSGDPRQATSYSCDGR
jgi:feruloyl esterase